MVKKNLSFLGSANFRSTEVFLGLLQLVAEPDRTALLPHLRLEGWGEGVEGGGGGDAGRRGDAPRTNTEILRQLPSLPLCTVGLPVTPERNRQSLETIIQWIWSS